MTTLKMAIEWYLRIASCKNLTLRSRCQSSFSIIFNLIRGVTFRSIGQASLSFLCFRWSCLTRSRSHAGEHCQHPLLRCVCKERQGVLTKRSRSGTLRSAGGSSEKQAFCFPLVSRDKSRLVVDTFIPTQCLRHDPVPSSRPSAFVLTQYVQDWVLLRRHDPRTPRSPRVHVPLA